MKFSNFKVGTRLSVGFAVLLLVMIVGRHRRSDAPQSQLDTMIEQHRRRKTGRRRA